jgi:hypothetical protein
VGADTHSQIPGLTNETICALPGDSSDDAIDGVSGGGELIGLVALP